MSATTPSSRWRSWPTSSPKISDSIQRILIPVTCRRTTPTDTTFPANPAWTETYLLPATLRQNFPLDLEMSLAHSCPTLDLGALPIRSRTTRTSLHRRWIFEVPVSFDIRDLQRRLFVPVVPTAKTSTPCWCSTNRDTLQALWVRWTLQLQGSYLFKGFIDPATRLFSFETPCREYCLGGFVSK